MISGNNTIALMTGGVLCEDNITDVTSSVASISAKNSLYEMLARSGTFQTAIGATGTAAEKINAAKAKIFLSAYIAQEIQRPFAAIFKDTNDKSDAIGGGESQTFITGGSLEVRFEKEVPAEFVDQTTNEIISGQEGEAEINFELFYGGSLADINSMAGEEGYLFIRSWDTIEGPELFESSEGQKNIYGVRLMCNWGLTE